MSTLHEDLAELGATALGIKSERDCFEKRIGVAIELAVHHGGIDGEHHKSWVIDQMVRALSGNDYGVVVKRARSGDDGRDTYSWDVGIAP